MLKFVKAVFVFGCLVWIIWNGTVEIQTEKLKNSVKVILHGTRWQWQSEFDRFITKVCHFDIYLIYTLVLGLKKANFTFCVPKLWIDFWFVSETFSYHQIFFLHSLRYAPRASFEPYASHKIFILSLCFLRFFFIFLFFRAPLWLCTALYHIVIRIPPMWLQQHATSH